MTALRDHELEITVKNGGELAVRVICRDQVPDYLARFSESVQKRARMMFWLKSPYERALWKATRGMPWYARMTVRQHIWRERAQRIQSRMDARAAKAKAKALRHEARMVTHEKVVAPTISRDIGATVPASRTAVITVALPIERDAETRPTTPSPGRPTAPAARPSAELNSRPSAHSDLQRALRSPAASRRETGSAWSPVTTAKPGPIMELLRREAPLAHAVPWHVMDRSRGR